MINFRLYYIPCSVRCRLGFCNSAIDRYNDLHLFKAAVAWFRESKKNISKVITLLGVRM